MTLHANPLYLLFGSVLILFRILHVETMFGNQGEGFLHACISSEYFITRILSETKLACLMLCDLQSGAFKVEVMDFNMVLAQILLQYLFKKM